MYIKYYLRKMLRYNFAKYIAYFFFLICIFGVELYETFDYLKVTGYGQDVGTAYCIIKMFLGLESYTPGVGIIFKVPYVWMANYVFLCHVVGDYAASSSGACDYKAIVESGRRVKMVLSHFCGCVVNEIVVGLELIAVIMMYTGVFGWKLFESIDLLGIRTGLDFTALNDLYVVLELIYLIVIGSFAFIMFQTVLSICFGGKFGFIASVLLLIAGTYYKSPVLYANFCMILRNERWCYNGMNGVNCLLSVSLSTAILLLILYLKQKKQDFM